MNFPSPKLGEQIRKYVDERLRKFMLSERVLSGNGILVKQTAGGKTLSVIGRPLSPYVYIGGKRITITGNIARYIWVDFANETAEYKTTTTVPFPDGIEIYDTDYTEIHIPRV
jgi:hypothetical protein